MDAIELLKRDHQTVTELFHRFNGGGGLTGIVNRFTGKVSDRQRRTAAEQICRELEAHTRIEEEIFYPAVRALGDERLSGLVDEAKKEHATVKQQVAQIRRGIGKDPDLQAKMNELQSNVDHHVREEENEMFPRVEVAMDQVRRDELGRELQSRKRSLTGGPQRAVRARGEAAGRGRGGRSQARARTTKARTRKTTGRSRGRATPGGRGRATQSRGRKRSSAGGRRRAR
jgi:hemerythrin superfamily protein